MAARIDSCVYHDWIAQDDVVAYLPSAWQEYVGKPGSLPWGLGGKDVRLKPPYRSPLGPRPAVDYDGLVARLAESGVDTAVLAHSTGMLLALDNNAHIGRELCLASNRWTVERWLEPAGSPFYGGIVVPNQYPDLAAAEIRRYAGHERVCAVHMGGNGLGKPFGHPAYHPIYEAAAEAGLAVAFHSMGDVPVQSLAHSTGGGLASFAGEYRALAGQSLMSHVTSVIGQGVFDKYPSLRVLVVGGGVVWIPSLLWRAEVNFGAFGRDVPWLKRSPTEYFLEHVRVATYRLERPQPAASLHRALRSVRGVEEILCYASGMPEHDADTVQEAEALLPAEWHDAVFDGNARALFGDRISDRVAL
jgi:uncharacterized protein